MEKHNGDGTVKATHIEFTRKLRRLRATGNTSGLKELKSKVLAGIRWELKFAVDGHYKIEGLPDSLGRLITGVDDFYVHFKTHDKKHIFNEDIDDLILILNIIEG